MGDNTTAAFILALIGGILILINGILAAVVASIFGSMIAAAAGSAGASILGGSLIGIGIGAIIIGLLVIVGSVKVRTPAKQKNWGIIILVLSLISFVFGGGFLIGLILGVIGGILALTNKK